MSFVFHFMNDTHFLVRVYHNTDICIVIIGVGTMAFNATFNDISVISRRSIFWWRKPEYPEKTTYLPQITDTLYDIMLYRINLDMKRWRVTGFNATFNNISVI